LADWKISESRAFEVKIRRTNTPPHFTPYRMNRSLAVEDSKMRFKRSGAGRSIIVAVAICALTGCAQFQNSFGEITDADSSRSQYALTSPDSASKNSSAPGSERGFTYRGVRLQMSDGELPE
jgi:hypothetical protein